MIRIDSRVFDGRVGINGQTVLLPLNADFDADAATLEVLDHGATNRGALYRLAPYVPDAVPAGQIKVNGSSGRGGFVSVGVNGVVTRVPVDSSYTASSAVIEVLIAAGANITFSGGSGGVPANALLTEDGTPILTEDGQYILTES